MVSLQEKSADSTGKISYEPLILRVGAASQYNSSNPPDKHAWRFDGLPDYWQCRTPLTVGQWYKVALTTKEHGTSQPYRDVAQVREAKAEEIPNDPPPMSQNGSQEEYRRSKEEMRWTEAFHMASRMNPGKLVPEDLEAFYVGWAGWFYNELANVGHTPEEPEHIPAEDDGLPF